MKFDESFEARVLGRTPNVVASGQMVHPETGWRLGAVVFGCSNIEAPGNEVTYGLDLVLEHDHGGALPQVHPHVFEYVAGVRVMRGPNHNLLLKTPDTVLAPYATNLIHFSGDEMSLVERRQA